MSDDRADTARADGTARAAVAIGPLTPADAARCAELERVLFPGDDPWSEAAFGHELAAPYTACLAARAGGALVGYAILAALGPAGDREFEVHTIGVDPAHQGRGIGRALLGTMLALADAEGGPVHLDVRTDNEPALGLYRAHGFEVHGIRRRYYQPSGADAYTMIRPARGAAAETTGQRS